VFVNGVALTGSSDTTTQTFVTVVPTGVDCLAVSYTSAYAATPFVSATISSTGDIIYQMNVRQITSSGYLAIFSDTITENGVTINTYAKGG